MQTFYTISVDVGRKGCQTVAMVIKTMPQPQGPAMKAVVNIFTMEDEHFEDQCIKLKKLFYKYKARRLVIDGNGLGIGLVDYLIKPQNVGSPDYLPPFGVYNDSEGYYKKYKTDDTEDNAIYIIKANATLNTEAHANLQTQLMAGKIKFLIDERSAKAKLMNSVAGQKMSAEDRAEYLRPYTLTSILKDELLNLREESEGINIILKQANRNIKKDKFSALEYGMYYIKIEEEDKKRRKHSRISDFMFIT